MTDNTFSQSICDTVGSLTFGVDLASKFVDLPTGLTKTSGIASVVLEGSEVYFELVDHDLEGALHEAGGFVGFMSGAAAGAYIFGAAGAYSANPFVAGVAGVIGAALGLHGTLILVALGRSAVHPAFLTNTVRAWGNGVSGPTISTNFEREVRP